MAGARLLPWLLLAFALSVAATWGGVNAWRLADRPVDPLLSDGDGKWRNLSDRRGSGVAPFPQATGRAAALQNTLQLGLCFVASLVVSALIAHPLLATTSVMLSTVVLVAFGYRMQRQESESYQADEASESSSHA
jgi:hypothetical protein